MKLASLKEGGRDGTLIVVNKELTKAVKVPDIAPHFQYALDHWANTETALQEVYALLNQGKLSESFSLDIHKLASPLPRAYQWADGSAYLNHVELVRKARGAEMPPSFLDDPLMYQGGSDIFIGPTDPVKVDDESWGIDFEAEVAVVTNDVPKGCSAEETEQFIVGLMLVNDVSLRNLIPVELGKGFGFFHSKPPTSFSPVFVTLDEVAQYWKGAKIHLPLHVTYKGEFFGQANAGQEMQFSFAELVSHAAKTRPLSAGTIIGSGTVSSKNRDMGASCLAEVRMIEKIETGEFKTPFMSYGDRIKIEMFNPQGQTIFGAIDQVIES